MVQTRIITPRVAEGFVSRQTNLGVDTYDLNELYSPDTELWKAKKLDIGSPKYTPNSTYAFDRSRYNNHGTITGALWKQLPSGLWYLNYDGDDLVNCGSNAALQLTTVTMLCWVKPTSNAADMSAFSIPYSNSASWDAPYIAYALTRNNPGSGFSFNADMNIGGTYRAVQNATASPINVWQLYGFTFDGTTVRTYVNGVAGATGSWTGSITYGTTPSLVLGVRSADSLGAYWIGGLALPRVISGAISAAVMLSIFQQERHLFGV